MYIVAITYPKTLFLPCTPKYDLYKSCTYTYDKFNLNMCLVHALFSLANETSITGEILSKTVGLVTINIFHLFFIKLRHISLLSCIHEHLTAPNGFIPLLHLGPTRYPNRFVLVHYHYLQELGHMYTSKGEQLTRPFFSLRRIMRR